MIPGRGGGGVRTLCRLQTSPTGSRSSSLPSLNILLYLIVATHRPNTLRTIKERRSLAARGRSLEGRVTTKRGRILGGYDAAMLIHWKESATTKTAPFRRNPSGAGGFGPLALSLVGHDVKTAPAASVSNLGARSSLRARNPKTPARGPRDFCHGLLASIA